MKRRSWIVCGMMCLAIVTAFVFTAVPASAAPQYTWRLAQVHPVDSEYDILAKEFARKVEERSNGRIHIDVFSGGVLGDWTETF